jgi:N6-L-threonylcarbamoyladenine synthase
MKPVIGLGIESSCDETSIALVKNGDTILNLKVYSQFKEHEKYRGVVPELATRAHLDKINLLLQSILVETPFDWKDLNYVSVTNTPGLYGPLSIGSQLAKTIHYLFKIPLIAVDHLDAHFYAICLEKKELSFPFLGVLLSGGNSVVFRVEGIGKRQRISETRDDAIGEAFDKIATLLDLSYPGGPAIEREAKKYQVTDSEKNPFPKLLKDTKDFSMSFSGIKTAVLYYLKKNSNPNVPMVCYYFQETVFELVLRRLEQVAEQENLPRIVASGGVLANETLKSKLMNLSNKKGWNLFFPEEKVLCTDNGAMVASLGYHLYDMGIQSQLDFPILPRSA